MAFFMSDASFAVAGDPERVPGGLVSANFFSVMGVQAAMGRVFTSEDQLSGHTSVVVISTISGNPLGSDPHVLGRDITIDSSHDMIVGVMPPGLNFQTARNCGYPESSTNFSS